ncbi:protein disulfide-isomerase 5-2-like [Olea europaea var. sylvestris]|uniref:protein disulfide-isomerase 5-2-like n=1 Tax=Olea europaea var. sylvestris TaxID=158386 RepID=UPI000C1CF5F0|nr:protein disulfide-isomerase 5-2-like [Olea europaea var. sylvestris]
MLPLIHVLLLFSSLLSFSPSISASQEHQFKVDAKVLELEESDFDSVISTFDYILVNFYAPWCGYCKRLAPELDKAAPVLAGLKQPIIVAKIDADKYKRLASKHEIDGYPTLKMFIHGVPSDYYGPRKADLLVQFLKKFIAPDVAILNSDSAISEFVDAAGTHFPIFIGFGLNESVISNLAVKYKKKAWFSVAKDFSDAIMTKYDFDKVPALASIHTAQKEQSIFSGPFEEQFLENCIKQNLFPLALPINEDTLQLLKDDDRKIVLSIVQDEADEKSLGLIRILKAAASANRDLIFGYVGVKQWEDFTESFEVDKKTKLPKMIVWDGNEKYFSIIGSESIEETDIGTQISRFLEDYREGNVIQKRITGLSFIDFIGSQMGIRLVLMIIFVVAVMILILTIGKEEPPRVGRRDQVDHGGSSVSQKEAIELLRATDKED